MTRKAATSGRTFPVHGCKKRPASGRRRRRRLAGGGLEPLEQLSLDRLVPAHHAALRQHAILAVGVADIAARLAQDDDAGGEIPRLEVALPEAVEPAGRGPR